MSKHTLRNGEVREPWHLRAYLYWQNSLEEWPAQPNPLSYWIVVFLKAPLAWLFNTQIFGLSMVRPVLVVLAIVSSALSFVVYTTYNHGEPYLFGGIASGLWTMAGSLLGMWHFAHRREQNMRVVPYTRLMLLWAPLGGLPLQMVLYAIRAAIAYDNCPRLYKPINRVIEWFFTPVYKRVNRLGAIVVATPVVVGLFNWLVMFYMLVGLFVASILMLGFILWMRLLSKIVAWTDAHPGFWTRWKRGDSFVTRWVKRFMPSDPDDVWTVLDD